MKAATDERKEVALLLNRLILLSSAKATQPPGLPPEDRITDADVEALETRILALYARAALKGGDVPVAYLDRDDLADLQRCNGRSVWAESPRIWGENTYNNAQPPVTLVAVYAHLTPAASGAPKDQQEGP